MLSIIAGLVIIIFLSCIFHITGTKTRILQIIIHHIVLLEHLHLLNVLECFILVVILASIPLISVILGVDIFL